MTRTAHIENLLIFRLFRTYQDLEAIFAEQAKSVDVTPRQLLVLAVVARRSNASQAELVARTGIDRSTLSDIVRRMVKKDLLSRVRCKDDRRAYEICLTSKGEDTLASAIPIAHRAEQLFLEQLTAEERSAIFVHSHCNA